MRFIPTVYTVLFYHSATEICFNQNYLGFYDKNCWSYNDFKYLAPFCAVSFQVKFRFKLVIKSTLLSS